MKISSTRPLSSRAGADAMRALGSQEEDAPVVLGAEAGIDGEASENFFDCFTAFTEASSLSKAS
jgi:hypothetical protein